MRRPEPGEQGGDLDLIKEKTYRGGDSRTTTPVAKKSQEREDKRRATSARREDTRRATSAQDAKQDAKMIKLPGNVAAHWAKSRQAAYKAKSQDPKITRPT